MVFSMQKQRKLLFSTIIKAVASIKLLFIEFASFLKFLFFYNQKKLLVLAIIFESHKNQLVKLFTTKRGRYNRPFLHVAAMVVLGIGATLGPILTDTYPIFGNNAGTPKISNQALAQTISLDSDVFATQVSQKPRDKVITYTVEKGDTISTIGKKFGISDDTLRWVNHLNNDNITIGDELKILPVTGIHHKVSEGDTVYSIAKKYDTNPQKIVDFPFNDFANPQTFSLVVGQMIVVPDGVMPKDVPIIRRQVYIAQGPTSVSWAGFTWPLRGEISQFASWYHMGIDITSPVGTPIVASQNGRVTKASAGTWDGGYGTSVVIDNGGGYSSNYAHLSSLNVGAGDNVEAGKTVIGWVGLTGRTTGSHLHFEIRRDGVLVNPLSYLQ